MFLISCTRISEIVLPWFNNCYFLIVGANPNLIRSKNFRTIRAEDCTFCIFIAYSGQAKFVQLQLNSSIAGPSWLLLAQARATCYQRSTEGQSNRPKAKKIIINPKKMTKRGRNWPMAKVIDQKAKAIEKKAKVIDQKAKVINPSLTKGWRKWPKAEVSDRRPK